MTECDAKTRHCSHPCRDPVTGRTRHYLAAADRATTRKCLLFYTPTCPIGRVENPENGGGRRRQRRHSRQLATRPPLLSPENVTFMDQ